MFKLKAHNFANLANSPLKKLVVSDCNIEMLFSRWFDYIRGLRDVSFRVTTILYFDFWNYFSTGLEKTDLNNVRLSITTDIGFVPPLPMSVGDGFSQSHVVSLELTDTKFYSVENDIIVKLPKSLKYLNLTHNYIRNFGVEKLSYLENLETLDLSNQLVFQTQSSAKSEHNVKLLETKSLDFLSHWTYKVSNNQQMNVKQLQIKSRKHFNITTRNCFRLPYSLKTLDVSNSGLLCNMAPAFCGSNNSLKILNASKQKDRSCFKTRSFWFRLKNLANLEDLNLNGNLIADIPHGAFVGLYKLKKLSLYDNKLLELSFDVSTLISLEILDVSANSIGHASHSFTSQTEEVSKKTNLILYLSLNPIVCNCKQLGFVSWVLVTRVISNKNKLNCTFENGTRISIEFLSHVHEKLRYSCTMLDVTTGCAITFWGLNVVLGGLAYILTFRQKLKYLVSFGRRTLNPYHPTENSNIEMVYDAYISYDGDFNVTPDMTLRDFVIYKIVPGLEQRGIRVIIREELDPGTRLYETITQTVRRSNKVLVLLTNDYCSDMWNVFEFNQAIMEGIYTNRQIAIPVLFESLRRQKVKDEICAFLQMEPVHKYSPALSERAFIDFLYERIRDTRQFD